MRSSTSSFDAELALPARKATLPLAVAVVVAVVALVAIELGWRRLGFTPSTRDTPQLWASMRAQARARTDVIVIVGSSRAQLGLDPAVLHQELGRPVVQLAMTGASALPVLQDLALDEEFRGVVLCDVTPSSFFLPVAAIASVRGADWVALAHHAPYIAPLETRLRTSTQQHLALLTPETNPRFQLTALVTKRTLEQPSLVHIRPDRFGEAHYARGDTSKMIEHWAAGIRATKQVLTDDELRALSAAIAGWVARIRQRGGDVIFVRLPSSGAVADAEAQIWPRAQFWDRFVGSFASKALHFADEPALRDIAAAEGSHLDAPEAAQFSRELARIARGRGWL